MKDLMDFAKKHPVITFLIVDSICVCINNVVRDIKGGSTIKITPIEED